MRQVLQVVVLATVFALAAACGDSDLDRRSVAPARSADDTEQVVSAVCAPSSEPCEDVLLYEEDGTCTTNAGRACAEAQADWALGRWLSDPSGGPAGGGDTELLEILDEDTVVVGYAFGSDLTFRGVRVHDAEDHVSITLSFDRAPQTTDSGEPVYFTLELRTDREIVNLPTPLGDRWVEVSIDVATNT